MTRYVGQGPTEQPAPPAASVEIPPEVVEKAAHAMYADNEVGEWEDGHLDTLLQYRRAARIALEAAALPYLVPAEPEVSREEIEDAVREALESLGIIAFPTSARNDTDEPLDIECVVGQVAGYIRPVIGGFK